MFTSFKKIAIAALMAASAVGCYAQEDFTVSTGDPKTSVYHRMFTELRAVCPIVGNAVPSTGSVENLSRVVGNEAKAGIVQMDMLFLARMQDPKSVANVRRLVLLHPEELHFVARGDVRKEGGVLGFGAKTVAFKTVSDLANRPIGVVGGSERTSRIFSQMTGIQYNVRVYPNNAEMSAALLKGEVDGILLVGGAPHPVVSALDTRFKILSVPADVAAKVKDVYSPATLSYNGMNVMGVPTVATQAALVTRTFRSAEMNARMAEIQSCFTQQLGVIQDKTGTHAKWQAVDLNSNSTWPAYGK